MLSQYKRAYFVFEIQFFARGQDCFLIDYTIGRDEGVKKERDISGVWIIYVELTIANFLSVFHQLEVNQAFWLNG